jgi:hypothetical protein
MRSCLVCPKPGSPSPFIMINFNQLERGRVWSITLLKSAALVVSFHILMSGEVDIPLRTCREIGMGKVKNNPAKA